MCSSDLPGLGDQAIEVSSTVLPPVGIGGPDTRDASVVVTSGNVLVESAYYISRSSDTLPAGFPAQAADEVAIARDVLAVLTSPQLAAHGPAKFSPPPELESPPAATPPPGPDYASPRNACTLPSTAVLAEYDPGATVEPVSNPSSGPGVEQITQLDSASRRPRYSRRPPAALSGRPTAPSWCCGQATRRSTSILTAMGRPRPAPGSRRPLPRSPGVCCQHCPGQNVRWRCAPWRRRVALAARRPSEIGRASCRERV